MRVLTSLVTFLLGLTWFLLQPVWASAIKPGLAFEQGFAPEQDLTVWPLQIAHGYPLVRAQIGDVQGVLMLDTGTPFGLLLNSARVKLSESRFVFSGTAGSGQKFDVNRASAMPVLTIHGQTWATVHGVHAADLSFIELGTGMGPYLGFIGANFFKGTALTLDYARHMAVIQRLNTATGAPLAALPVELSGSALLATLRYRGSQPNFPVFDATLGGTPVQVMLDSGNPGASIDQRWLTELQHAGAAQRFTHVDANQTYRLPPLQLGMLAVPVDDVSGYNSSDGVESPGGPNLVKIGFSLLKRLAVTWNYQLQTMTFFTP